MISLLMAATLSVGIQVRTTVATSGAKPDFVSALQASTPVTFNVTTRPDVLPWEVMLYLTDVHGDDLTGWSVSIKAHYDIKETTGPAVVYLTARGATRPAAMAAVVKQLAAFVQSRQPL